MNANAASLTTMDKLFGALGSDASVAPTEADALKALLRECYVGLKSIEHFETNRSTMTITLEHAGCIEIARDLSDKITAALAREQAAS